MATQARPVILVTGSTDGIGLETARTLARRGARIILHGRREERLTAAARQLTAHDADAVAATVRADLSVLDEVRGLAARLAELAIPITTLLHNAGVFETEKRRTVDGFERTLAVNHLAPFLLTHLVLTDSHPAGRGLERIVNVSSVAHTRGELRLDDLHFDRRPYDGYRAYAASKLANVLFTVELARRLRRAGRLITVNALHPGVVSTKLLTTGFGMQGSDSLAEGAATSVHLALDPEFAPTEKGGTSGRYYAYRKPAPTNPAARNDELVRRFYEISCELTGVTPLPG